MPIASTVTHSVDEAIPSGWDLTSASCSGAGDSNGTPDLTTGTISGIDAKPADDVTCTFNDTQNNPSLSIDKSSTTTSITAAGQVVPYSYLVTNTGNVSLTGVTVTDSKADAPGVSCPQTTLAVGANMTCTASHTVTQAAIDDAVNLSNTGIADSDQTGPAQDSLDIPIAQSASLSIDKSSTTTSITAAGQVVPYSYLVTNTGNVSLTGVTVTDSKADAPGVSCPQTTLAVGANMTCTASHTVTQAEIDAGGNLSNTGIADSDQTGPAQDSLDIPIAQSASLSIDKSSTTTSITAAGQVLPYSYLVTNTGNVSLTGVTVTDSKADAPGVSCPQTTLAVGANMTCTASHTV